MEIATRASLDAGALREARRLAAGRRVIGVVKADAYGHGARWASESLVAAGCDLLAVVTVAEAAAQRDASMWVPRGSSPGTR